MAALLYTLIGIAVIAAGHVVFHAAARVGAARLFGIRPLYRGLVITERETWERTPRAARVVIRGAGALGGYAWIALIAATAALVGGRYEIDEASMRVAVSAGGPAYAAGIRDGDRVLAVDGAPIASWSALKSEVSRHRNEKVDLAVERDGATLHLAPTVDARGQIRVGPIERHVDMGLAGAARYGVVFPVQVIGAIASGAFRLLVGAEKPEVAGPVGIVRAGTRARGGPGVLAIMSAFAAYFWPIALLLMIVPLAWIRPARDVSVPLRAS